VLFCFFHFGPDHTNLTLPGAVRTMSTRPYPILITLLFATLTACSGGSGLQTDQGTIQGDGPINMDAGDDLPAAETQTAAEAEQQPEPQFETQLEQQSETLSELQPETPPELETELQPEPMAPDPSITTDSPLQGLSLVAPQTLPSGCIGVVDQNNTRFCVNPDTRLMSATLADESVWWSFTLPGENESNEVESVLVTDDWLILVADIFPQAISLTPGQRANQYEATVFEKTGAFVNTFPLFFDLQWSGSNNPQLVNNSRDDGPRGTPVAVTAFQTSDGQLRLVVGWNRWRNIEPRNMPWDFSGVTVFDLSNGEIRAQDTFEEQGVVELALAQRGEGVIRILTTGRIEWRSTEDLGAIGPTHFAGMVPATIVNPPDPNHDQLNGSNYQEVIERILPWINADSPRSILIGRDSIALPGFRIDYPFEEFALLEDFEDPVYFNNLFACSNGGSLLEQSIRNVSIIHNQLDGCRLFGVNYSGFVAEDFVGRDGFLLSTTGISVQDDSGDVLTGTFRYTVNFFRTLAGSARGFTGAFSVFNESRESNNAAIANYSSSVQFLAGVDLLGQTTCYVQLSDGDVTGVLNCRNNRASGSVDSAFTINAGWSSYSNLEVVANLDFGQDYFDDLIWSSSVGAPIPEPLPIEVPTAPPTEFFLSGGSIEISALDGSRIVLEPLSPSQHPFMQVRLYDKNGIEAGNFPVESVEIKCSERRGLCLTE